MSRVRLSLRVDPARIRTDLDPRLLKLRPDVLLAHHEEDRTDPMMFREQQFTDGVGPVLPTAHFRDLRKALTDVLPVFVFQETDRHDPFEILTASHTGSLARRVDHLGLDGLPGRIIG